jgi:hypothetical protein
MGIFNIFKKSDSKNSDDIAQTATLDQHVKSTPAHPQTAELDITEKAKKDLELLNSLNDKLSSQELKRVENNKNTVKKKSERPEETRAREALSIQNPFRGV